ncbi:hypothetical protein [Candidatus Mycoplasma haematominutum]|uniref:Uncharacterized protein n=1 Tax=Candidatus Mycoplasma haematominutum 'Birmingham 1' TaxID=1116213 RepID=G8C3W0_9MOLU|nr:hypothetical protein [Candidatus Mycoplasma haematominutum]CCE67008.1 conserved haemoplasma hypothetical protein [Candidatus Mycoplasma haematominutum 'Birmingham 1']
MGILLNLLLSKFKAIAVVSSCSISASAITIPVMIAGDKYEHFLIREFNPEPRKYSSESGAVQVSTDSSNNYTSDTSEFTQFPEVRVSNSQLIKGTTNYNNGNYVLYFGSEACPNCNNFLYSENESPKTWIGANKNFYHNGILFETYSLAKARTKGNLKDLKFIFFSDEIPSMDYRNNDDLARIPWSKWDRTLVSQGYIKDDYIRYDKSAVEFRKLQSLLMYYFGEKASGIPTVIIYKNGIPFVYGSDKITELEEDKKGAGSAISHWDATAGNTAQDVILRFDLFRHLSYIFDNELEWVR